MPLMPLTEETTSQVEAKTAEALSHLTIGTESNSAPPPEDKLVMSPESIKANIKKNFSWLVRSIDFGGSLLDACYGARIFSAETVGRISDISEKLSQCQSRAGLLALLAKPEILEEFVKKVLLDERPDNHEHLGKTPDDYEHLVYPFTGHDPDGSCKKGFQLAESYEKAIIPYRLEFTKLIISQMLAVDSSEPVVSAGSEFQSPFRELQESIGIKMDEYWISRLGRLRDFEQADEFIRKVSGQCKMAELIAYLEKKLSEELGKETELSAKTKLSANLDLLSVIRKRALEETSPPSEVVLDEENVSLVRRIFKEANEAVVALEAIAREKEFYLAAAVQKQSNLAEEFGRIEEAVAFLEAKLLEGGLPEVGQLPVEVIRPATFLVKKAQEVADQATARLGNICDTAALAQAELEKMVRKIKELGRADVSSEVAAPMEEMFVNIIVAKKACAEGSEAMELMKIELEKARLAALLKVEGRLTKKVWEVVLRAKKEDLDAATRETARLRSKFLEREEPAKKRVSESEELLLRIDWEFLCDFCNELPCSPEHFEGVWQSKQCELVSKLAKAIDVRSEEWVRALCAVLEKSGWMKAMSVSRDPKQEAICQAKCKKIESNLSQLSRLIEVTDCLLCRLVSRAVISDYDRERILSSDKQARELLSLVVRTSWRRDDAFDLLLTSLEEDHQLPACECLKKILHSSVAAAGFFPPATVSALPVRKTEEPSSEEPEAKRARVTASP